MISIRYVSSSRSPSGYGSAARAFITALFCAGVNLSCDNLMQMAEFTNYGITGDIADRLSNRMIPYKVMIIHLTPDLIPTYKEEGIYTINHLFWEMDKLPKEWIQPLNSIDEIWTASQQMAEMIGRSGVTTPCYAFSQPIDTGKATENIESFLLEFPKDFTFYTIGQWIDRKNFKGLLHAYWKTFQKEEKVSLLIKTYRVNYSDSEYNFIKRDIEQWKNELRLSHYPKVLLTKHLLSDEQIVKLHKMGDCYVSASSGEGWNRPMQEAMLYGNPVISGDNGGITDIMTDQYYYKIPSTHVNATEQSHIPWYTSSMRWKLLDKESLGKQMKFMFDNYDKTLERSKKAQEYIVNNFSFQKIGNMMKERLEQISVTL